MIIINAQLTWWVVFILRLNRTILDFERERLLTTAKVEAVRIGTELGAARTALKAVQAFPIGTNILRIPAIALHLAEIKANILRSFEKIDILAITTFNRCINIASPYTIPLRANRFGIRRIEHVSRQIISI